MAPRKGELAVANLRRRSEKGLELARKTLRAEKIESPILHSALEHYLEHWNDFIHPGLFSLACEAAGGDLDSAVLPQAAIAIIAASFDVHDDIIDKSNEKNQVQTVYGKFGIEIALLLGDALLLEGFKLIVDSLAILPNGEGRIALEALRKLVFEAGTAHALEVGSRQDETTTPDQYLKIVEMKAAAIEADMYLGALFGEGKESQINALSRLGRILGMLATIRDEFIDLFEIEELRQRICAQSLPSPVLFAMADQEARAKVMSAISKPKITRRDVNRLLDAVFEAKTVLKLRSKMRLLAKEGYELASTLLISQRKGKLQEEFQLLFDFMLEDL
jgi:geranylgeranyl pyrophosphate synthase